MNKINLRDSFTAFGKPPGLRRLRCLASVIVLTVPLGALAGNLDAQFAQVQQASWHGDVAQLVALSQSLAPAAAKDDVQAEYLAAYVDYRIAATGQRDQARYRPQIVDALQRAEARLQSLSTRDSPYQAEALALLSSVYGLDIAMDPAKGASLGYQSAMAINHAEQLAPNNPRVLLIKGMGKLFTPPIYGGDRNQAVQSFDRTIALLPTGRADAVNWGLDDAYIWRGMAQQAAGDVQGARTSFQQALRVAPQQGWATALLTGIDKAK